MSDDPDVLRCCGVPMWSYEAPGVYDGTCFWTCETCGRWKHRFPIGSDRRRRAERFAEIHRDQFPVEKELTT